MKRALAAGLMACMILASGCTQSEIVSKQPIDCDYIPGHTQVIVVNGKPQVIIYPEEYMIEYRCTHSDGSTSTRWEYASEEEYDRAADALDY